MADNQQRDRCLSNTSKPHSNKNTDLYYSSPIDRLSNFIDSHLLETRLFTAGLVGVGLIIIGRSIRIGTKFSSVEEIPERFVQRHVRLRGVVRTIDGSRPTVFISHIPITKFSWFKTNSDGLLPVSLYGVAAVQASGVDWLKSNCINREVWFQLFSTNEKNQLDCVIKLKRKFVLGGHLEVCRQLLKKSWMRTTCVNEFLVKNGLARVQQIEATSLDSASVRILNTIIKAEAEAHSKRKGIWKENETSEKSPFISKPFYSIKHFSNTLLTKCKNTLSYYFRRK